MFIKSIVKQTSKTQRHVEEYFCKEYLKPRNSINCDLEEILQLTKNQFKVLVPGAMHLQWKAPVLQVTLSNEKQAPPILYMHTHQNQILTRANSKLEFFPSHTLI